MKPGKVPPAVLERAVYPHLGRRSDVIIHAHLGEDCAVIEFGDHVAVLTTDPITGASAHLGRYAVHVACNDLATSGAEPVALLLTLLLPPETAEDELTHLMREAGAVAADLQVEIAGGHTEVTPGIDRPIAVVTAIGRAPRGAVLSASGARPGARVLLTKSAGVEGTAILATDLADRLRGTIDEGVLHSARDFLDRISVVADGLTAARAGATAMHDVTEGGVLGGAWELAEAAGIGIEVHAAAIPVAPETAAICGVLGVDPLRLISSGAMLIATPVAEQTLGALRAAGIPATEIGVMTEHARTVVADGRRLPLGPPERDELWRILVP